MISQTQKLLRTKIKAKFDKEYAWTRTYQKREYERKYFKLNILLLRFWHNGNTKKKLRCSISKKVMEYKANYMGIKTNRFPFQLHHPIFINGKSLNKEVNPSAIMKYNLMKERNLAKLLELLSCFVLENDVHAWIHESRRKSDIRDYPKALWPWALQNKQNFKMFFETNNIKPKITYAQFIKKLIHGN